MRLADVVLVGVGGGIGSILRWAAGLVMSERFPGTHFPAGTFFVNVTGAFVIGFLSTLFDIDWHDRYGTILKAGVLTGFLGGYTTFSSMQLDAAKLAKTSGRASLVYLLVTLIFGLGAAALGIALAR